MDFRVVPPTELIIGSAATAHDLKKLIEQVGSYFTDAAPVTGLVFSARIILQNPFEDSRSFGGVRNAQQVAQDLVDVIGENGVRYHPEYLLSSAKKGWQIQRTWVGNYPAVLAFATWCY